MALNFTWRKPLWSALMVSSVLLTACATTSDTSGLPTLTDALGEQTGQNGRACVLKSDIKSFGYKDKVLTINARGGYFIATTVMRCHNLDTASLAVFDGPHNEVCGGGSSSVGDCPIAKIFEFANRSTAFEALETAKAMVTEAAGETR
ncbi:hypothetical protein P886_0819 [Alteromonadaceae bacterium 2753L.S.0a.02]|nr:hypothetical protein P886_0819 [Alteromonadaceae bacterium 2753L.S.0a.02]